MEDNERVEEQQPPSKFDGWLSVIIGTAMFFSGLYAFVSVAQKFYLTFNQALMIGVGFAVLIISVVVYAARRRR